MAGELDAVAGEVFGWVKSTSRESSKIGFSQKREKDHQQQTPKSALLLKWTSPTQFSCAVVNRQL